MHPSKDRFLKITRFWSLHSKSVLLRIDSGTDGQSFWGWALLSGDECICTRVHPPGRCVRPCLPNNILDHLNIVNVLIITLTLPSWAIVVSG